MRSKTMTNRIAKVLALAMVAGVVLSGCNLGGLFSRDGETVSGLAESLVSFPASLANDGSSSQRAQSFSPMATGDPSTVIEYVDYVYRPVRDSFNPLAQAAIDVTNQLLASVEESVLSNSEVMGVLEAQGVISGYNDDNTEAYKVELDTESGTDVYTVQIWDTSGDTAQKTLHMTFQESGEGYKGELTIRDTSANAEEGEIYNVQFDANDAEFGKVTEVRGVNLESDDPNDSDDDQNIPTKIWVKAFEKDSKFYVNANIHYTQIQIEDQTAFGSYFMDELENGRTDSNVVASYIYQGIAGTTEDQGAVSLALVPSNESDDTDVFAEHAYGEIYKRAIGNWVRDNPEIESGVFLIPTINDILFQVSNPQVSSIDDQTSDDDIFTALGEVRDYLASGGSSTTDLDAVLFVVDVVNPGYYSSEAGFVGTDTLNKPSWADELTGTSDPFVGDIEVSAGDIAATDFTVTMPEPASPDF
jgi:hypothetical protein